MHDPHHVRDAKPPGQILGTYAPTIFQRKAGDHQSPKNDHDQQMSNLMDRLKAPDHSSRALLVFLSEMQPFRKPPDKRSLEPKQRMKRENRQNAYQERRHQKPCVENRRVRLTVGDVHMGDVLDEILVGVFVAGRTCLNQIILMHAGVGVGLGEDVVSAMAAGADSRLPIAQLDRFSVIAGQIRTSQIQMAMRAFLHNLPQERLFDGAYAVAAVAGRACGAVLFSRHKKAAVNAGQIRVFNALVAFAAGVRRVQRVNRTVRIGGGQHGVVAVAIHARCRHPQSLFEQPFAVHAAIVCLDRFAFIPFMTARARFDNPQRSGV